MKFFSVSNHLYVIRNELELLISFFFRLFSSVSVITEKNNRSYVTDTLCGPDPGAVF